MIKLGCFLNIPLTAPHIDPIINKMIAIVIKGARGCRAVKAEPIASPNTESVITNLTYDRLFALFHYVYYS